MYDTRPRCVSTSRSSYRQTHTHTSGKFESQYEYNMFVHLCARRKNIQCMDMVTQRQVVFVTAFLRTVVIRNESLLGQDLQIIRPRLSHISLWAWINCFVNGRKYHYLNKMTAILQTADIIIWYLLYMIFIEMHIRLHSNVSQWIMFSVARLTNQQWFPLSLTPDRIKQGVINHYIAIWATFETNQFSLIVFKPIFVKYLKKL